MPVIRVVARSDVHGDAWLRQLFEEEGALWLRVGPWLDAIRSRLTTKFPDQSFDYDIDFSLVESVQVDLGRLEKGRYLTIFDFDHPVWVHTPGTFCSSCMVPDLQFEPEDEVDGDEPDHPSADDPFAQERAEDLAEAVRGMTIEQHADCALCLRDFILELWQHPLHEQGDLVYCQQCRDLAEQRFGR